MRTLKITLAALMIVVVTACSDDGDDGASAEVSEEARPYVEGLSKTLAAPEELGLEPEQADCLAAKWVNTARPERLKEAGVEPDGLDGSLNDFDGVGLSKEEATTMVAGFDQCGIDLREELIQLNAGDEATTDEEKKCLEDALDMDVVKESFIYSWSDAESEEAEARFGEMVEKQAACTGDLGG